MSLTLFVSALQPAAISWHPPSIGTSERGKGIISGHTGSSHFFGLPLDPFGLFQAAVVARFRSECAGDVDPGDM